MLSDGEARPVVRLSLLVNHCVNTVSRLYPHPWINRISNLRLVISINMLKINGLDIKI